VTPELVNLPEDSEALKALVRSLILERDRETQRAEQETQRAEEQQRQAEQLRVEKLRLELELERFRKWYYGPSADRLQSSGEMAQMLLAFAVELDRKPVHPGDAPPATAPADGPRNVRRRKGRRNLANFENLPVTKHVHELSAEDRACSCCGAERQEIGADESWQIEYYPGHFERIQHLRKKYACPTCESNGDGAQIETAAKPEAAIEKGMAGPGLLAYIVTSKFSDYLPLYRLEDIFERQGFEISRATQSVWCGDVADLVGPLYELMAARVRASHRSGGRRAVAQDLADYFQVGASINLSARVAMTKDVSSKYLRGDSARLAYSWMRWRIAPLVIGA
jgi:transposase